MDIDVRTTYWDVLDLGFDIIRLGAYWDEIEKKEGEYDFSMLDWQIEQAKEKGVDLVVTVGMKAPRWPEFFIPDWVLSKMRIPYGGEVSKSPYLREKTLRFIETVVERYAHEKAIRYWQVENEAMDRSGANYWWIGWDFLKEEVELVRKLDKDRRLIILTAATYPNKVLFFLARFRLGGHPIYESLKLCDILGINVYPVVGHKFWRFRLYFWSSKSERNRYFSTVLKIIRKHGKQAWIMELQAEPWEPGFLVYTAKERPPTAWPEVARESFKEFQDLGYETIFLWGAEYWRFRSLLHEDREWWELAIDLLKKEAAVIKEAVEEKSVLAYNKDKKKAEDSDEKETE